MFEQNRVVKDCWCTFGHLTVSSDGNISLCGKVNMVKPLFNVKKTDMETISKLTTQLEVVKTERIRQRSTYMSRIRESAMQELADSIRPGLTVQEQPPYHLPKEEKK